MEKRKYAINDCFSQCIAFILNIHPMNVPYFAGMKDYVSSTRKFMKKHGYQIMPIEYSKKYLKNKKKYYLIQGLSPRKGEHCVIYKGTKPYFDPNYHGNFLKGKPHTLWVITKLKSPSSRAMLGKRK